MAGKRVSGKSRQDPHIKHTQLQTLVSVHALPSQDLCMPWSLFRVTASSLWFRTVTNQNIFLTWVSHVSLLAALTELTPLLLGDYHFKVVEAFSVSSLSVFPAPRWKSVFIGYLLTDQINELTCTWAMFSFFQMIIEWHFDGLNYHF